MMGIEPWIDLLAAALLPRRRHGPVVIWQEAMRSFPLVETRTVVSWLHSQPAPGQDFECHPRCQPLPRARLHRPDDDARRQLAQAELRLVRVPSQACGEWAECLSQLAREGHDKGWLLYGAPQSPGWQALAPLVAGVQARELPGAPTRLMVSPDLLPRLDPLGLGRGFGAQLAVDLARTLAGQLDLHIDLGSASGHPRLRLRSEPVRHTVTFDAAMIAHTTVEGRALFSPRGLGGLLLPWNGCQQVRMLLRNVRARVDELTLAVGGQAIRPSRLDYTDQGALMTVQPAALPDDATPLLYLNLPRPAVPDDGFCDVGAVEFSVELA